MPQLFDSEGNPIDVMGEEELAALQEKAAKAESLEATLKEKEEQLGKLSEKEFNFSKFREVEESKRQEMLKGFSSKEKALIEEISSMKTRQDELENRYTGEHKEVVLNSLVGQDKESRQKLEDLVKEMYPSGLPRDKEGMEKAYRRATIILEREQGVNPLNKFMPITGQVQKERGVDFSETPQGRAIIEEKFAREIAKAKSKGFKF